MSWVPHDFLIATSRGPETVAGYTYRHLGLHIQTAASPKERRPPVWSLTHLGSGHCLAFITGKVTTAFPIASEIAECGDWDFGGLKGYLNRDPEIQGRYKEIFKRHGLRRPGGSPDETVARRVTLAREEAAE